MRIVVFGAGAIGSLLGARLASAGHEVLLVARAAHARAIDRGGLVVTGRTEAVVRLRARSRLEGGSPPDAVLLTVKAGAVRRAARSLARGLSAPAPVLALQNGIGIEAEAIAGLRDGGWTAPERWLVRGVNTMGATFAGPGRVVHAGEGEILLPADASPADREAVERFEGLFASAGIPCRRAEAFAREVWRKVLVNAAVNPVTADHGVENGALLRDPLRGQAERLLREAQAVARAEGFAFADDEADRDLWRVVRATARNRSSMLQDLDRRRRTEIRQISGALLEAGERHGLDLPATRRAVARILRREAAARSGGRPGARSRASRR